MLDNGFADAFARDWIEAWNDHDLERLLSHSADGCEMASPVIREIAGEVSGTLTGKAAVGAYWANALTRLPELCFEWLTTLIGVNRITRYYRGPRGLAAEVFHFGPAGNVIKAYPHDAP